MANEFSAFDRIINERIKNIRTAFIGKVVSINGSMAMVQPLIKYGADIKETSLVSVVIPSNVKCKTKTITYMVTNVTSATMTVLVPDSLAVGDIVYVGICDRDITTAKNGIMSEPTRQHDINDGVILRVL